MTNQSHFKVSFRITHPTIDSSTIDSKLMLTPKFSYTVGEKKITPKGTEIDGIRNNSFWCHEFSDCDENFESSLKKFNKLLGEKSLFLKSLSDTGGTLEYFVGWFQSGNSGFVLDVELISQIADMGIQLSFNIYE
jgi:hypothetical protein